LIGLFLELFLYRFNYFKKISFKRIIRFY